MNYQPDRNKPFMDISKNGEVKIIPDEEHNARQRQLRIDTFACAAMQLIAEKQEGIPVYPFIAKECYDLAEAMEAERARRIKG